MNNDNKMPEAYKRATKKPIGTIPMTPKQYIARKGLEKLASKNNGLSNKMNKLNNNLGPMKRPGLNKPNGLNNPGGINNPQNNMSGNPSELNNSSNGLDGNSLGNSGGLGRKSSGLGGLGGLAKRGGLGRKSNGLEKKSGLDDSKKGLMGKRGLGIKSGLKNALKPASFRDGTAAGAAAGAAGSTIGEVEIAKIARGLKRILGSFAVLTPVLLPIFFCLLMMVLIMMPILFIGQVIGNIHKTLEKLKNFIFGNGWNTNVVVFKNTIEYLEIEYKGKPRHEGEFDTEIIQAAVTADRTPSYENYSDDPDKEESYDKDENAVVIPIDNTNDFYGQATNDLGNLDDGGGPNMKLVGALVDKKMSWSCYDNRKDYEDAYSAAISEVSSTVSGLNGSGEYSGSVETILDELKDADYSSIVSDVAGMTYKEKTKSTYNILKRMYAKGSENTCEDKELSLPSLTYYIDYEMFADYLKNDYVPDKYVNCKKCKIPESGPITDKYVNDIIQKIFDNRNSAVKLKSKRNMVYYRNGKVVEIGSIIEKLVIPTETSNFYKDIKYYNQNDFASYPYGTTGTIQEQGCGPTSLSIVLSTFLGKNYDPVVMTKEVCERGYCTDTGTSWISMYTVPRDYGLKSVTVSNTELGVQQVIDALSTKKALVVAIMGSGHFTNGGHFIVLSGINTEGQFYVVDPNSTENTKWWDADVITSESSGSYWIITE